MVKANNYYVGQKFREITKTAGVDTPVAEYAVPVIVINPTDAAAEVQPSLPKTNVKQTFHVSTIKTQNSTTATQIATATPTTNIYFLGYRGVNQTAVATSVIIADAASGGNPTINADTLYTDASAEWQMYFTNSIGAQQEDKLPFPKKVVNGLRFLPQGGASTQAEVNIYWMEETIN